MILSREKINASLAFLSIVAFILVLFYPAIFGDKILAPLDITKTMMAPWNEDADGAKPHNHSPSDAVTQYLPYRMFAEKSFEEDGYIGWNPYEMGGYNLAANTMALPGTWTMQLHRFLPFKDAWNIGIIAEFLIAGTGMLVFLRSRKLPWLACIIGTIAFMANSQFIFWIYHRWALSSFCWMPWVLWSAMGISLLKDLRPRHFALPFFLAFAMMGATLQHCIFIFLGCFCIFLSQVANFRKPFQETPRVAFWAFAFFLATAMVSFTLVPQIQGYLSNISIGNIRGELAYSKGASQPLFNFAAIFAQIWPWLVSDPQTIDGWRLLKSYHMSHAYLGTIPMVLGICGVFHRAMPRGAKWLIVLGLLIPLTPLVGPLYHRVQLLFLLGAAWMTAEMLAYFAKQSVQHPPRWHKYAISAVAAIGLGLTAGSLLPSSARLAIEDKVVQQSLATSAKMQFGEETDWIESRARSWTDRFALHNPSTAWIYSLLILGTGGLILATRGHSPNARKGHVVILTATSLELLTVFQGWTTFTSPEDLKPHHPLITEVKELAGSNRVLQGLGSIYRPKVFAQPNMLAAYGVPAINAYESIQYPNTTHAVSTLPVGTGLDLAGVGISVMPLDQPPLNGTEDWPIVNTRHGFVIRHNPHVIENLISGSSPIPADPSELSMAVKNASPISPELRTMNKLTLRAPDGATWLRISQNWHEGWRWKTPSGEWQPFQRGVDNACWIETIPTGEKQIEARFFPRSSLLVVLSVAAAVFGAFIIIFQYLRHQRLNRIMTLHKDY